MEGKLIKVENGYVLMVDNIMHATDNDKLSLKNCQAIANGYDLDELAENNYPTFNLPLTDTTAINTLKQDSFKEGFQKALEILGDKKYILSEEDLHRVIDMARLQGEESFLMKHSNEEIIQSLQHVEWDVEIELGDVFIKNSDQYIDEVGVGNYSTHSKKTKLDENGCLILKRKENGR